MIELIILAIHRLGLQLLQLRFSTGVWKFTAQDFIFCTFYYTFSLRVIIVRSTIYECGMCQKVRYGFAWHGVTMR